MDNALCQSAGDRRSERSRAATAAGDPKHGILECLAQGTGVGRRLMRYTFEQSDRAGLPCYLETFSDSSVRVHESQLQGRPSVANTFGPTVLY